MSVNQPGLRRAPAPEVTALELQDFIEHAEMLVQASHDCIGPLMSLEDKARRLAKEARALAPSKAEPGPDLVLCRECRHYREDEWANVGGIPLIVAHQICKFWGGGCKTDPFGYCFKGERDEMEEDSSR